MSKRYRVLKTIWYATDPAALRRLRAGENLPLERRGLRRAGADDVVSDLPRESVPWLLEAGAIEEAAEAVLPSGEEVS